MNTCTYRFNGVTWVLISSNCNAGLSCQFPQQGGVIPGQMISTVCM